MRKVAEEEQSSLELFRKTAAVVSKNDRLVDYQREERRNANGSPGKINQRVWERNTPVSIAMSLTEDQPVCSRLDTVLISSARIMVLNPNERMLWTRAMRRMRREVICTSDT